MTTIKVLPSPPNEAARLETLGELLLMLAELEMIETPSEEDFDALQQVEQEFAQTHRYAQAVVESIGPLLLLDSDLRVTMANKSFYEHFRVSPPQTENCLVYDLGNGQWNIPELRGLLAALLPGKGSFKNFEVTHQFEIIGCRTMLLSGHQVDPFQRILLLMDDITDRAGSRAVMREVELRYRRLFEGARDGILIVDPCTRKITDANPFMTELLGYNHQELLGKELWEIGVLSDEEASRVAFRELQTNSFIRYENLPLQTKEGQPRQVEFVSRRYQEHAEDFIQCNIRDITERKHTEEALRRAKERLRPRHRSSLGQAPAG